MGGRRAGWAAMIGLALLVAAGAARAQETRADWLEKPSGDALSEAYPERAQRDGVEGHAVIHCQVATTGRIEDCKVISEEPAGYGFGDAALKVAPAFRMAPATAGGSAQPSDVRIPIRFALPPSDDDDGQRPFAAPDEVTILLIGGAAVLTLLSIPGLAALNDRLRRRGARTAEIGVALERAFGLVGPAWRQAPVPLLLYAAALGAMQGLGPAIGDGPEAMLPALGRMFAVAPLVLLAALWVRGALLRIALRPLRPQDPAFRGGPLGLRLGQVEVRVLVSTLALSVLVIAAEGAVLLAGGLAIFVARAADATPAMIAVVALGIAILIAAAVLAFLRLSTFLTASVAEGGLRLGASWRATRACLLPPILTSLVLAIAVGAVGSAGGGIAMIALTGVGPAAAHLALGIGYGIGASLLAPTFVGASAYFYEALQAPREPATAP